MVAKGMGGSCGCSGASALQEWRASRTACQDKLSATTTSRRALWCSACAARPNEPRNAVAGGLHRREAEAAVAHGELHHPADGVGRHALGQWIDLQSAHARREDPRVEVLGRDAQVLWQHSASEVIEARDTSSSSSHWSKRRFRHRARLLYGACAVWYVSCSACALDFLRLCGVVRVLQHALHDNVVAAYRHLQHTSTAQYELNAECVCSRSQTVWWWHSTFAVVPAVKPEHAALGTVGLEAELRACELLEGQERALRLICGAKEVSIVHDRHN
jgi:hypothetical protein